MIAAIVGSRDFNDYDKLCKFIYKTCIDENYSIREIVSGGARKNTVGVLDLLEMLI